MIEPTKEEWRTILMHLFGKDEKFASFFNLYSHRATAPGPNTQHLSHDQLLGATDILRNAPHLTRAQFRQVFCLKFNIVSPRQDEEIEKVLNLAVQCLLMVDCTAPFWCLPWRSDETLLDFVLRSFPEASLLPGNRTHVAITDNMRSSMKAWKLKKRHGLKFQPTHDISKHMLLDRNCLYLFHHAKVLKAQLEQHLKCGSSLDLSVEDSLKSGTLPPQLLVETLHSMQDVIFPSFNGRSGKILDKLIARKGFDTECRIHSGYYLVDELPSFQYVYWGDRMLKLQAHLKSRPPRNRLERWLKWQSSEGNALLVAFAALLISITVGIVSIGLSAGQLWIAWRAWKHPVS